MARIGLLGGTFNPPHLAHLVCAQEAHSQLGLDRVVLIPVRVPPHKLADADPGGEARLELCALAVGDDPRLETSRLELDRDGPSYTVDTLRALHARDPGDELTFIIGSDQARALQTWHEPEEVLRLATLAVAERTGADRDDVRSAVAPIAGAENLRFFDMPRIDVSSSEVRRRVRDGRPIRYLVPDAVAEAITERGLYGKGGA